MYIGKYTIEAYDKHTLNFAHINIVKIIVFAANEADAIAKAQGLAKRKHYDIIEVEMVEYFIR